MAECTCSPIVTGFSRPHKVIGRTIDTTCPVHGVNAPPPRDVREIARELMSHAEIVSVFGQSTTPETKARMRVLCREYFAATEEGADHGG